jgi:CRISPR-associated endonuclease/helicase Cas3
MARGRAPGARNVAVAVGGHHGIFPTDWDGFRIVLGNDRWTAMRRDMLAQLAGLLGVTKLSPSQPTPTNDQSIWMVADWIGSNQEFFKPIGNPGLVDSAFDVDCYFAKAKRLAEEALEKLGWLGRADTSTPVTFAELFPSIKEARPLQTAVAEIVSGMTEPTLLIVEAPMGEGKTEAGWYAAECWDRRGGQGAMSRCRPWLPAIRCSSVSASSWKGVPARRT